MGKPTPFPLPAILDPVAAAPLADGLRAALGAGDGLTIDASAVERLSTPAAQVLLAAARSCEQADRPFRVRRPAAAFTAALTDLGLASSLKEWSQS
ncbi:MAG: STAS domain-containing protein [Alphaproteobacteria bacterium]|nr:STAS domain-containing protein [Alphaproteobacteria bacterium]